MCSVPYGSFSVKKREKHVGEDTVRLREYPSDRRNKVRATWHELHVHMRKADTFKEKSAAPFIKGLRRKSEDFRSRHSVEKHTDTLKQLQLSPPLFPVT